MELDNNQTITTNKIEENMASNVQLYDEDGSAWDAYVAQHRDSSNYHRYGWKQVVERSFGHTAHYVTARNRDNQICGILPLVHMRSSLFGSFLVSLPFFNYGGILSDGPDQDNILLGESRKLLTLTGADHAELRHLAIHGVGMPTKQHKVTMILDLEPDEEQQWNALDTKVRNQVRKAEKSGLSAIHGHLELLDGFYEVFCRNMRDLGTPVYAKSFFRNILETFPATTRIISIVYNGRTVASGLLTWFRTTLEVPWASSIRDFRAYCPNNLLYWEAIRFALRNRLSTFDFGRSTPGEGTYHFKKQWGAQPVPLYWQYLLNDGATLPELNPANPRYRTAIRIWRSLPVAATKLLGPPIVRCIP